MSDHDSPGPSGPASHDRRAVSPAYPQQDQPVQTPASSGGGCGKCCLFGCLGAVVLAVVAAIGLYLAVPYFGRQLRETYTATEPKPLPKVEVSEEELGKINQKLEGFQKTAETRRAASILTLSAHDINALIANSEAWKGKPGRVYVRIEDDKVLAEVSIPLDEMAKGKDDREMLDKLGLRGRYFNATSTIKLSLHNGELEVYLDEATVKGKPVPGVIMATLRKQNLAQDLSVKNPKLAQDLRKLESIEVKDGLIIIRSKAPETQPGPADGPGGA